MKDHLNQRGNIIPQLINTTVFNSLFEIPKQDVFYAGWNKQVIIPSLDTVKRTVDVRGRIVRKEGLWYWIILRRWFSQGSLLSEQFTIICFAIWIIMVTPSVWISVQSSSWRVSNNELLIRWTNTNFRRGI